MEGKDHYGEVGGQSVEWKGMEWGNMGTKYGRKRPLWGTRGKGMEGNDHFRVGLDRRGWGRAGSLCNSKGGV